ncbi:MAG: hypothetical protein LBK44_05240 [Spirochaetales bacterium]|jgi:predicted transposase YdaD|nr:hypothetical protein [Spirochaetales bacterium]
MAGKVLIEISRDERERARLMSEYKYELDTQSRIVDAKREGKREGIQEGRYAGGQTGKKRREIKNLFNLSGLAVRFLSGFAKSYLAPYTAEPCFMLKYCFP